MMILLLTGLIKMLIGLVGVTGTIVFASLAAFRRTRKGKLQYAGLTLFTTINLIFLITVLEFLMYPSNSKSNQLILTAHREAALGAYWLGIYEDSMWELGNSSREIEVSGTYKISGDTLYLKTNSGTSFFNGETQSSFVLKGDDLLEVNDTGIRGLKIGMNKIKGL